MSYSISISIVSHGQGDLVRNLLDDLDNLVDLDWLNEVILTLNIPEQSDFQLKKLPLRLIQNDIPKGFGANHNAALKQAKGDYLCVLNPDIRLTDNPFIKLVKVMKDLNLGLIAPAIVGVDGQFDDSARKFPTFGRLLKRLLFGKHEVYPFKLTDSFFYPDWVGGMFMLFDRRAFQLVKGFDERYFLYYEDVDICVRLWQKELPLAVLPHVNVLHQAQRQSHRRLKYLRWHLISMIRFFAKHLGRYPKKHISMEDIK
ncbi:glycosyltransferase [Methylophaga sp.]|uniref:glycosyltransferase n=1 Tax=Methylophaga sp. TaxID=2024840 RepID=UPI0027227BCE|nr:glycosyltransferase [Methylophaga sp.]MDO8828421.1 glycosyltransferase [Methylophaga sp.]